MKIVQIALKFKGLSALLVAQFGQTIFLAMTNNLNFPNPYPLLGNLQTAIGVLNSAINAQQPGNKASTSAVVDARKELNRILKALASYVEFESNTDETKALTSGFNLKHSNYITAGNAFTALQGIQSGTVDLSSPGTGGAYNWYYTTDPIGTTPWILAASTTLASNTVTGLTPGLKYWFRVAPITSLGQQPYSDSKMVHVI